jgi:hypothetical protein
MRPCRHAAVAETNKRAGKHHRPAALPVDRRNLSLGREECTGEIGCEDRLPISPIPLLSPVTIIVCL